MKQNTRIAIAMSGGVDSSVAALLMKAQGYDLTGVTMSLLPSQAQDIIDAKSSCDRLGIPHTVYDLSDEFKRNVIEPFIAVYEAGGTPNPCIICNRFMKFGILLDAVLQDGQNGIATGHYARVEQDGNGRYLLKTAADATKDQSYVLWQLTQHQLAHTLFPLGGYTKAEIREMAEAHGLVTAHKSDSQDICFVPDGDYAAFIRQYTGRAPSPGEFVDTSGHVLGMHKGIIHYTIGQRKGLGIALGQPMFVKSKDVATGRVVLSTNDQLFSNELTVEGLNLIATERLDAPIRAEVKIRYQHKACTATITQLDEGRARIVFDEPQRAAADGQSAVFYDGDTVIGGGFICAD